MDMADIMEDMVMEITEVMGDMVNNTNQKEKKHEYYSTIEIEGTIVLTSAINWLH